MTAPTSLRAKAGIALFLAAVLGFLFAASMAKNLNHDEHQFIAPAVLVAYDGLQPYRDFPLFHLPNLVFLYAALFRVFDHPFLAARCFSVFCAFTTAALIFRECWYRPPFGLTRWRFITASVAVLFLLLDPLFFFTTGRAWNHDSTGLFIILAAIFQVHAARLDSIPLAAASAICAGLAAGIRLTVAPILIPLWISIWFFPSPLRRRAIIAALYVIVATATFAPSLYYLAAHTDPFLFGNFEFPRLRLLDPENERIQKTMHPLRKLRFFFKEVAIPSLPLFLSFIAFAIAPAWKFFRNRTPELIGTALILAILPFALIGCFTPSRYQYQHYFIIIPLLVLGVVFGTSILSPRKWMPIAASAFFLICLCSFTYKSSNDISPGPVSDWFPNRTALIAYKIAEQSPHGPILTLAPIFPMEAGLRTYSEFSTGPFAWKSARFVAAERRAALHLVAPDDLATLLTTNPPGGILTGVEESILEKPLVEYSRTHQFTPIKLSKERTLWLPPRF
ncbi:MAG: hypothetical protein ABIZ56_08585 [Chthoniobacteraceae bacterium]